MLLSSSNSKEDGGSNYILSRLQSRGHLVYTTTS